MLTQKKHCSIPLSWALLQGTWPSSPYRSTFHSFHLALLLQAQAMACPSADFQSLSMLGSMCWQTSASYQNAHCWSHEQSCCFPETWVSSGPTHPFNAVSFNCHPLDHRLQFPGHSTLYQDANHAVLQWMRAHRNMIFYRNSQASPHIKSRCQKHQGRNPRSVTW